MCSLWSGAPRGAAQRPFFFKKTGMRAATRLCRPRKQLSPQGLWSARLVYAVTSPWQVLVTKVTGTSQKGTLVAYPVGLAGSSGESFLSVPELPQMLRGPGRVQLGHWTNSNPSRRHRDAGREIVVAVTSPKAGACCFKYRHLAEKDLAVYPVGLAGSSSEFLLSAVKMEICHQGDRFGHRF